MYSWRKIDYHQNKTGVSAIDIMPHRIATIPTCSILREKLGGDKKLVIFPIMRFVCSGFWFKNRTDLLKKRHQHADSVKMKLGRYKNLVNLPMIRLEYSDF